MPDGNIKPFQRFCNQCGSAEYKLIKRQQIDAYDLHYSLSVKEIDYADDRINWGQDGFSHSRQQSGYGQNPFDIVEGEVLRKQYFHQKQGASGWKTTEWSPSAASATTNKFQLPKVLNPPLWEKTRI
ncbi:MAG: hypothetical protein K2X66_06440 [Cyanobacteria bacterium]|nr:hypothetical protein [Cyanobacteriota bacterium]